LLSIVLTLPYYMFLTPPHPTPSPVDPLSHPQRLPHMLCVRPPPPFPPNTPPPHTQEYIHHLVFEVLGDGSIVDVLKKLMKLPWSDTEPYLLKCLLKVGGGGAVAAS